MSYVLKFLKTRLYWVSASFILILFLSISFIFNNFIQLRYDLVNAFDESTAKYVAYENRDMDKNSFYFFGKSDYINSPLGDSEILNVDIYQQRSGVVYDSDSLFQPHFMLQKNEIAIPKSLANKFGLKKNDVLYMGETELKIAGIYNDVYGVYSIQYSTNTGTVILGESTLEPDNDVLFANFFEDDNATHSNVYILSSVRQHAFFELSVFLVAAALLMILSVIIIDKFKAKVEKIALARLYILGDNNILRNLTFVELFFIVIPVILSSAFVVLIFKYYIISSLMISIAVATSVALIAIKKSKLKKEGYGG